MVSVPAAPDTFKGSLATDDVALAPERGLLEGGPDARVGRLALVDGGEGSVAAACAGRFSLEATPVAVNGNHGQG